MIGYITIGTNDLERASQFYTCLLDVIGGVPVELMEGSLIWSFPAGGTGLVVKKPFDGNAAAPGNGPMIALTASCPEEVQKLHTTALDLGATNEGDPGVRADVLYCAYCRDRDGNKLNFYCTVPSE